MRLIRKTEATPSHSPDDFCRSTAFPMITQTPKTGPILTPAKKILCRLSIGKQRRQFFLTYNPATRAIDPPPCTICKTSLSHIHFNSRLEPVCYGCRK